MCHIKTVRLCLVRGEFLAIPKESLENRASQEDNSVELLSFLSQGAF